MELRKCKECGKMFQPKGREQYCSDIHYRPCPVCGKPVIAKYLSDPARRCDDCKGKKADISKTPAAPSVKPMQLGQKSIFNIKPISIPGMPKQAESKPIANESKAQTEVPQPTKVVIPARVESAIFCDRVNGNYFKFIRQSPLCGWLPNHTYLIHISQDNSAYIITSSFDNTLGQDIQFNGRNRIAIRCTSQTSFYNYFQPMWEKPSKEAAV